MGKTWSKVKPFREWFVAKIRIWSLCSLISRSKRGSGEFKMSSDKLSINCGSSLKVTARSGRMKVEQEDLGTE